MNQQAQQMQMNIDLKNTEKVEFDGKCFSRRSIRP